MKKISVHICCPQKGLVNIINFYYKYHVLIYNKNYDHADVT